jgi:hypothetical protein
MPPVTLGSMLEPPAKTISVFPLVIEALLTVWPEETVVVVIMACPPLAVSGNNHLNSTRYNLLFPA